MVRGIPPRTRTRGQNIPTPLPGNVWNKSGRKVSFPKIQVERRDIDELHVDIFNEVREVIILIEAPGLEQDHLTITLGNPLLILNINNSPRYGKGELMIKLPCKVNKRPLPQIKFANSLVQITLRKPTRRNKKCHDD